MTVHPRDFFSGDFTKMLMSAPPWLVALLVVMAVVLGLYAHGLIPWLSQEEAETQCAECVKATCPLDKASLSGPLQDPVKACATMKASQACTCSGGCARLCRQSNLYRPDQCTQTYCA